MNRSYSLKRHKEFRYTYRVGKSSGSQLFSMVWADNKTSSLKIGFSVSKRIGNSVKRNRAKRRLRACITPLLPRIKKGHNIIFIARQDVLIAPFSEMQRQMTELMNRAKLLENQL